jgi:serine phosphatase RsbU (regulator of sigma subunit)
MQQVLDGILEISRTLATKFKDDDIGPVLMEQLIRIFPKGRRYFLYATVPNSNRLRLLSWKINPIRRRSLIQANDDELPRYSRTIYRLVIEEKNSALMTETDAANSISESMLDMEIRSVMVAPVLSPDGEVKGMIQVDTDKNSEFKLADLEILKVIAQQVGATMQMAELHKKALEQSKLKSDLENASDILNLFLPQSLPKISGFEFFVEYKPREDVGGDFYDFIRLDENRLAICVCDVVGKGLPAALIMARLSSELKHVIRTESEPCKAFTKLDEALTPLLNPPSSFESRFVSMSLAVIDLKTLKMTMVNAGHPPLLLKRADGRVEQPDSKLSGHLMAVDFGDPSFKEDNYFELGEVQLAPGDTVVYYSDGVTDARNKAGHLFCSPDDNNLLKIVEATSGGPTTIGKTIVEAIRKFSEGTTQFDDITLSCFGPVIR